MKNSKFKIEKLFSSRFTLHASRSKGQALVENILLLPILCIMISMIVWFSRLVITRQQILTAARYGTDMIVYTKMDESEIRQEIKNYLTDQNIEGRRLNPAKLPDDKIKIDIYRYPKTTVINASAPVNFTTSSVEIYYEFGVPTIFKAWSSYISNAGELPEKIYMSGRSEVLAGTGCKGDNHP